MSTQISQAIEATRTRWCLECGKCTANCPIARDGGGLSPRRMMSRALLGAHEELMADPALWSCLGCAMCEARCPSDVEFPRLLRQVRAAALPVRENEPVCNHSGTLQSLMRLMTTEGTRQNRRDWIDDGLEVAEEGEVLLFVGCAPYFDAYFQDLEVDTLGIARSAVKVLNGMGIAPVVSADERCCGHDLLWTGDTENFARLVERNAEAVRTAGAKTIVTTCAECFRTLRQDYREHSSEWRFEVRHLSELVAEKVEAGELELGDGRGKVTYHDPCRLGRHSGVYDAPRRVLEGIRGLQLVEMDRSRERAACCGTSAWINCDQTSRRMQASRLEAASTTGAETLVTSCPKCLIHFKCALKDRSLAERAGIRIQDLSVVTAEALPEVRHATTE